jgi:hypothetical protein
MGDNHLSAGGTMIRERKSIRSGEGQSGAQLWSQYRKETERMMAPVLQSARVSSTFEKDIGAN